MAYIKSKSNYTLQINHKTLDGDTKILERDMATVGGLVRVSNNQVPIYQSGNFILTINQPNRIQREFASSEWVGDGKREYWTLESDSIANSVGENTTQVVLKRDYYKLSDFSYYGSCSELIRSSINHIISIFPGEIYKTSIIATYEDNPPYHVDDKVVSNLVGYYRLDNPFNIDIHTPILDSASVQDNSLKYFANNGWMKYDIVSGDTIYKIHSWKIEGCDTESPCVGELSRSKIIIEYGQSEDNVSSFTIYRLRSSYDTYDYVMKDESAQFSIRPQKKYLDEFYSKLDNFEKILLDKDTIPKYTAIFEILSETDKGYAVSLQKFTFPTAIGGYNLSVGQALTNGYVDSLVSASASYDDLYCDNLWRSMTHEAIKNFDWTFTKEIEDASDFIEGGNKIQKLIRLVGREFDEIKSYIDGIANYNTLTYDDIHNAPDYVLSDLVEIGGFEVQNIYPFKFSLDGRKLTNVTEDVISTISPYKTSTIRDKECGYHKFAPYTAITEFSAKQVNNYFLKTLKMNIGNILKRKGTIEGIETLLSLFGMKSKRWVESLFSNENVSSNIDNNTGIKSINWDFDVNEYTVLTSHLVDGNSKWDSYNKKKIANYNTLAFRSGIYEPYQGLPLAVYYKSGEKDPILYPYFSKNKPLDGDTYYQMYGGWLRKVGVQYDKDNNIIDDCGKNLWFTQTINRMRVVENLEDLFALNYDEVENGEVCKVANLNGKYLIVDGLLLPIYTDSRVPDVSNSTQRTNEYIKGYVTSNGSLIVGKTVFSGNVTVSDGYKGVLFKMDNEHEIYLNKHNVSLYAPNTEIRIYLIELDGCKTIICQDDNIAIGDVFYWDSINRLTDYSPYFLLHNKEYKDLLDSELGWEQLSKNDERPFKYKTIVENYSGNNPHASLTNSVYDDGYTYIERLAKPFRYALEHGMFNDVSDTLADFWPFFQDLEEVTFKNMIIEAASTCTDCIGGYSLTNDKKIHSFGNYYTPSLEGEGNELKEYSEWGTNLTSWFEAYSQKADDVSASLEYNTLISNNDGWRNGIYGFDAYSNYVQFQDDNYGHTEQIVNTKRVNIDFNIPFNKDSNDRHYAIKYIDSVIIPYLEQVLPSTIIVHINYKYLNG